MRDGGSYACFGLKLHISRFSLVYVLNWLSKMKYLGIGVICAAGKHSTVFLLNFFQPLMGEPLPILQRGNQGLERMLTCIGTGVGHICGIVEALGPFLAVLEGCVEMSGIWYA